MNSEDMTTAGGRSDLYRRSRFTVLDLKAREALIRGSKAIDLKSGQTIFMQGETHEFSYVIESGLVRTYYGSESGREITLGQWSEGDVIGGPLVFGGGIHVWSSVATKATRLLAISGGELRKLADLYPGIYPWIVDVMSFKMMWLSILFQVQGTEQVQQRLVMLLLMLGDIYGQKEDHGTIIGHSITQSSLASLIGASRQWTNKSLNALKEQGLIDYEDRHVVLLDRDALRGMIGVD